MTAPRRQKGVALITAILITALVSSVALGLAWDNALDMRRTMILLYRDQAIHVAMGAENWVGLILREDLADSETDHLGEIWATELPGLPIDGGELFGAVEDLQGRFNINNLVNESGEIDPEAVEQFRRLLSALELDPRFAGIAADWIDSNQEAAFPDGAEDGIYTGMVPPYRAANLPITNATEMAALEGMDKASFDILSPHIVALPGRTGINVNTATAAVLRSLDENLSQSDVDRLITEREGAGFTDVQNSFSTLVTPEVLNQLQDSSEYFQLRVIVRIATVRITYFTTFQRGIRGDVVPILRSFGTT